MSTISTGMEEAQIPIKRTASVLENNGVAKEQKTAEGNVIYSNGSDQPSAKRVKSENTSSSVTTADSPIFYQQPVNVALQVSAHCRIGPVLDETRILSLPSNDPLPYPDEYTRAVQNMIRCARRPEEVVAAIKVASIGEPSMTISFFDKANGKFECKNIPVVESVNSAQLWLSDLLDSLGCCKKLFVPDFIAKDFVCKQCFCLNQELVHAHLSAREGLKTQVDIKLEIVEEPKTIEEKRNAQEEVQEWEEKAHVKEQLKKEKFAELNRQEEEKEKLEKEEEERAKLKRMEDESKRQVELEKVEEEKIQINAEKKKKKKVMKKKEHKMLKNEVKKTKEQGVVDEIMSRGNDNDEEEDVAKANEIYRNIHAFFLHHFPQGRNVVRRDLGIPVVSNCPEMASMEKVKAFEFFDPHARKMKWRMGDELALDRSYFMNITTHRCLGYHSTLITSGTMLDLWLSLIRYCPNCLQLHTLQKAMDKIKKFIELERFKSD